MPDFVSIIVEIHHSPEDTAVKVMERVRAAVAAEYRGCSDGFLDTGAETEISEHTGPCSVDFCGTDRAHWMA
jgi:hypothetical protein